MKMVVTENTSLSPLNPSPKFCNSSFTNRIFSDVAGDVTIVVDGESFLLHKFPLVARSGKIRKMVADAKSSNSSKLELYNLPGGFQSFELVAKFCYGINFEINSANVANLRCAAEYLEMSDNYHEENLISRTEAYLNDVAVNILEKSVQVLSCCEALVPIAEELGILERCVNAIAENVCHEQSISGLDFDSGPLEWWIEDLSRLKIDSYRRVISALVRKGVRADSIINSLMHYAQTYLKGIGKQQIWNPARANSGAMDNGQRAIVETLVTLLPSEKSCSIHLYFIFGMLRMAIMVDASLSCRLELERRISIRLEMVSLDDLLIPSIQAGDSTFDVDTVHRILVHFLHRIEEEEEEDEKEHENCGYESEGFGSPSHESVLKVGRLVDEYLVEIASDPSLSLHKFVAMVEVLPDYARVIDDGLYRAVDIYLKAHPMLPEQECKKLCKLIDCQKLSQEATNHAAQNDRLPPQMAIRVLYFEQIRLKNSLSLGSGDAFLSQKISSNIPSAAMSPRDNYASLRRENRELKLEISRMRVRLTELEKEQVAMKQGMLDKSGKNGKKFLLSLSKGFGRIGIFNGPVPGRSENLRARENAGEARGILFPR